MRKRLKTLTAVLAIVFITFLFSGQGFGKIEGDLRIYHAGSLTVPMKQMIESFNLEYPDVKVITKSGGSTKMARLISSKGEKADLMASADFKVIDNNLIPDFADWNIRFATNQLVLCFTEKSKFADEVTANNWYEVLQNEQVKWGHSDPNLDPCGYRSLMVMQLAEKHYGIDTLYEDLLANRPEENVKAKAIELVQLLKSGELDYGWEYLSVAIQHGLNYVTLDEKLNLGSYQHDDFYKQAEVKVTGKEKGSWKVKNGKSVTYGITMLKDAENPEAARAFLEYMLSSKGGLAVLKSLGQPPFIPARVPSDEMHKKLPKEIAALVEVQ